MSQSRTPLEPCMPKDGASVRYHYLDNLRALALLAGVILHVGLGFCVITAELWPSANRESSMIFDYWVWLLHTFRMPLFFLIAGFFAHYLMSRRGISGFVKNRLLRITLPFLIFWPLAFASIVGIMIYAALHMNIDTPIINMVRFAVENPDQMNGEKPPASTTHLWFIYYLSIFSLVAACICWLNKSGHYLYQFFSRPWVLFVLLPLILSVVMTRKSIPHPSPDSFMPSLQALVFYGAFYVVGWVFFVRQELLALVGRNWLYLSVISVAATVIFCRYLPEPMSFEGAMEYAFQAPPLTPMHLLMSFLTAVLACYLSFLSLWVAFRFANQKNALMRYISDGSYWVYIMHLPLVTYLQYYFHNKDLPLIAEFLLILVITLGAGYLSYAILVRHTPIGWLLNGRKKKISVAG